MVVWLLFEACAVFAGHRVAGRGSWWQAGASEFVHGDEAVDCLNGNFGSLDIGVDSVR